jgi:hypothetical protein
MAIFPKKERKRKSNRLQNLHSSGQLERGPETPLKKNMPLLIT